MTKLQAINTMLLYINEAPVVQADIDEASPLQIIVLANSILDENIRTYNATLTLSVADISSVNILVQDYIVKRASKNLFTRVIGFEDKGLEVILIDEKQAMGNVARYVSESIFSTGYEYILPFIYKINSII